MALGNRTTIQQRQCLSPEIKFTIMNNNNNNSKTVSIIGIGAMGGGMARRLVDQGWTVQAYDHDVELLQAFSTETKQTKVPTSVKDVISKETRVVLIVLQTQAQCQAVCFDGDDSLVQLLSFDSIVVIHSTVTPAWMRQAAVTFAQHDMHLIDCPISGGPVRARQGELTMLPSCSDENIYQRVVPLFRDLAHTSKLYVIKGDPGQGSTVKCVHQLLAGVHICVAAEALALASKSGLDVAQLLEIVQGAAGASWMMGDRGPRMLQNDTAEIKSQLRIFLKDLDIVYQQSKAVQAPIPVASAALQQFVAAAAQGWATHDDSQVVQAYGGCGTVQKQEGNQVGEYWKIQGKLQRIVEVGDEPRHKTVLQNVYCRALRVSFPAGDTTLVHRHAKDSLYFFLVPGGLDVINHVQGLEACADCMEFGEVRYGTHETDAPLVHQITNKSAVTMLCIDAEVLSPPPVTAAIPLVVAHHELIKERPKCRVYKLTLQVGESVTVSYSFFHLVVVVDGGTVAVGQGRVTWQETPCRGDVAWKQPVMDLTKTNTGSQPYVEYIAEWR